MTNSIVAGRILDRLEKREREQGTLPGFLRFYRELLRIQWAEEPVVSNSLAAGGDPSCQSEERDSQEHPLLTVDRFQPDWEQLQRLFTRISEWLAADLSMAEGEARGLKAVALSRESLVRAAGDWQSGRGMMDTAREHQLDPELLELVLGAAMRPFLNTYAAMLSGRAASKMWARRYCPVCGGNPDFSYLHKDDGARWLVCSRCDSEWRYLRVACPRCGNENQDDISYLVEETGRSQHRLYLCERCHGYMKTMDLRGVTDEVFFPLERLLTLPMDRQASEKGYHSGQ